MSAFSLFKKNMVIKKGLVQACAMVLGVAGVFPVMAQNVLIKNATVHTVTSQGSLKNTDVLVENGVIRAIGANLSAGSDTKVVNAEGKPLTPTLFAGITSIGVEEVSGESSTVDNSLSLKDQPYRPEFDATLAFNPDSVLIPVAQIEGLGFSLVSASTGGAFVAGQGGMMRFDGSLSPLGPHALFLSIGAGVSDKTGQSRAAQWMLLDQLVSEARNQIPATSPHALLTNVGRETLAGYLAGKGRIVVDVHRASDIRQVLAWSKRENVNIAISGASEGWKVARELAQANVPVFVDALANLPSNFDQLGSSMKNAGYLAKAGVQVGFSQSGDAAHNARKIRQLAGNAVANGMSWEDGLAGITRVPAQSFGVGDKLGSIAVGQLADLVLWTGDPLDVANTAEQVWVQGKAIPMRSRQTELRDRYLNSPAGLPRAYSK